MHVLQRRQNPAYMAMPAAATMKMPPESPSMPSIMLKALITPSAAKMVSGTASFFNSSTWPVNRLPEIFQVNVTVVNHHQAGRYLHDEAHDGREVFAVVGQAGQENQGSAGQQGLHKTVVDQVPGQESKDSVV